MQVNEIQQRFRRIERTIQQANQACRSDTSAPQELRDCVQQLNRQSQQVKQVLQSEDTHRIRQCVDDLELLGDRAQRACERADDLNDTIRTAVDQVHNELSTLKHQLH